MNLADFFNDPMRAYGLMMFLVRAKEGSSDANVVFDAHSADFGLLLRDHFQGAIDQDHPRLGSFPRGPVYLLTEHDPVYLSLRVRLREFLSHEDISRSVRGRDRRDLVRSFFSPFRLDDAAAAAALAPVSE